MYHVGFYFGLAYQEHDNKIGDGTYFRTVSIKNILQKGPCVFH